MRAGARRRDWQLEEIRFLLENAGRMPKQEICRRLRRSSKSVERMASRLRSQGHAVDLRCYRSQAIICPSCGRRSVTARETGICRPCTLRRRLAVTEGQISALLSRLPADVRSIYEDTEAEKGARTFDQMPRRPAYVEPPTLYQRLRDEESFDRAMEEWEARRIQRELKAAQKRKERIHLKVRQVCKNREPNK